MLTLEDFVLSVLHVMMEPLSMFVHSWIMMWSASVSIWGSFGSSMGLPIQNTWPATSPFWRWLLRCFCMCAFCLKPFPQTGQENGLSPEWTRQCCPRLCLVANCFPHTGQSSIGTSNIATWKPSIKTMVMVENMDIMVKIMKYEGLTDFCQVFCHN